MPMIERATSQADLEDAYRFWYRVYVQEMARHREDPLADHHAGKLRDPIATKGCLLLARSAKGSVVGTVMNTQTTEPIGKYEAFYGLDRLSPSQRRRSTITTKLMVEPRFRGTKLPMQLARAASAHTLEQDMLYDFIDCNNHLVGFFEKIGYRAHRGRVFHPDYGHVNSMYIALQDAVHLHNVGSPIYPILLEHQEQQRVYA